MQTCTRIDPTNVGPAKTFRIPTKRVIKADLHQALDSAGSIFKRAFVKPRRTDP